SFEFFLSEFPDFIEKYVKLVFEMFVPKREVFHGKPHVGDVARSAVHLCENGFHPVNGRVTQQPIVLEHNWINLLGFRRQQIEMTIERFVKEIHIRPKTSRHKAVPVLSKEMIVENIDDYACIVMISNMQSLGAFSENRMGIGESVDGAMKHDSPLDVGMKMSVVFSAYPVGHEVSDLHQLVVAR